MSRSLVSPRRTRRTRTDAIQISSAKVSATWTNSGSRITWRDMRPTFFSRSGRDAHELLAEVLAAQQPHEGARRVLDALGDILAVLDLALRAARSTRRAGNRPAWRAKSVTMKPRIVSRLVSTVRIRIGSGSGLPAGIGRVVLRDQAAHRNPRERIEQRKHRLEHRAADILEIDVDAFRAGGLELSGEIGRAVIDARVEAELLLHIAALVRARRRCRRRARP